MSELDLDSPIEALVLGIGNVLWADEGFGVRAVERMERELHFASEVRLVDGGTQGLYLVPLVQAARRLLVFDAVDYGDAPGALRVVRDAEVPKFGGVRKMSLHQTGFQEVLELAALLGELPAQITLVGVQAGVLEDYGGSLSPAVAAELDGAILAGRCELFRWGFASARRAHPKTSAQVDAALSRERYEGERPSAELAFRGGDPRFLELPAPGDRA